MIRFKMAPVRAFVRNFCFCAASTLGTLAGRAINRPIDSGVVCDTLASQRFTCSNTFHLRLRNATHVYQLQPYGWVGSAKMVALCALACYRWHFVCYLLEDYGSSV